MNEIVEGEDDVCAVCGLGHSLVENQIVFCETCGVPVHQDCYGVTVIPHHDPWYCKPCSENIDANQLKCAICNRSGGAFKRIHGSKNKWGHVICGFVIPELCFTTVVDADQINMSKLDENRRRLECIVCHEKGGACAQCAFGKCRRAFHASCAVSMNSGVYVCVAPVYGELRMQGWCDLHTKQGVQAEQSLEATNIEEQGDRQSGGNNESSNPHATTGKRKMKRRGRPRTRPTSDDDIGGEDEHSFSPEILAVRNELRMKFGVWLQNKDLDTLCQMNDVKDKWLGPSGTHADCSTVASAVNQHSAVHADLSRNDDTEATDYFWKRVVHPFFTVPNVSLLQRFTTDNCAPQIKHSRLYEYRKLGSIGYSENWMKSPEDDLQQSRCVNVNQERRLPLLVSEPEAIFHGVSTERTTVFRALLRSGSKGALIKFKIENNLSPTLDVVSVARTPDTEKAPEELSNMLFRGTRTHADVSVDSWVPVDPFTTIQAHNKMRNVAASCGGFEPSKIAECLFDSEDELELELGIAKLRLDRVHSQLSVLADKALRGISASYSQDLPKLRGALKYADSTDALAIGIRRIDGVATLLKRDFATESKLEQMYLEQRKWAYIRNSLTRGVSDRHWGFNRVRDDSVPASWMISVDGRHSTGSTENTQRQRTRKNQDVSVPDDDDAVCQVCFDGVCDDENAILFCDSCNVAVHQKCYGEPKMPDSDAAWYCKVCSYLLTQHHLKPKDILPKLKTIPCALCGHVGGAMKPTTDNRFVHVFCAIFTPGTYVCSLTLMEPIEIRPNIARQLQSDQAKIDRVTTSFLHPQQSEAVSTFNCPILAPLAIGAGMPINDFVKESLLNVIHGLTGTISKSHELKDSQSFDAQNVLKLIPENSSAEISAFINDKGGTNAKGISGAVLHTPTAKQSLDKNNSIGSVAPDVIASVAPITPVNPVKVNFDSEGNSFPTKNILESIQRQDKDKVDTLLDYVSPPEKSDGLEYRWNLLPAANSTSFRAYFTTPPPRWTKVRAKVQELITKEKRRGELSEEHAVEKWKDHSWIKLRVKLVGPISQIDELNCMNLPGKRAKPVLNPWQLLKKQGIWCAGIAWIKPNGEIDDGSDAVSSSLGDGSRKSRSRSRKPHKYDIVLDESSTEETTGMMSPYPITDDSVSHLDDTASNSCSIMSTGDVLVDSKASLKARLKSHDERILHASEAVAGQPKCVICNSAYGRVILVPNGHVWIHPLCAWYDGWFSIVQPSHKLTSSFALTPPNSGQSPDPSKKFGSSTDDQTVLTSSVTHDMSYCGGGESLILILCVPEHLRELSQWPCADTLLVQHYANQLEQNAHYRQFVGHRMHHDSTSLNLCSKLASSFAKGYLACLTNLTNQGPYVHMYKNHSLELQTQIRSQYRHTLPFIGETRLPFPYVNQRSTFHVLNEQIRMLSRKSVERPYLSESESAFFLSLFGQSRDILEKFCADKAYHNLEKCSQFKLVPASALISTLSWSIKCTNFAEVHIRHLAEHYCLNNGSVPIARTLSLPKIPKRLRKVNAPTEPNFLRKNDEATKPKPIIKPVHINQKHAFKPRPNPVPHRSTPTLQLMRAAVELENDAISALIHQVQRIVGSDMQPLGDPKLSEKRIGRLGIDFMYHKNVCAVCWQKSTQNGDMVQCRCCGVHIHKVCYGVLEDDWRLQPSKREVFEACGTPTMSVESKLFTSETAKADDSVLPPSVHNEESKPRATERDTTLESRSDLSDVTAPTPSISVSKSRRPSIARDAEQKRSLKWVSAHQGTGRLSLATTGRRPADWLDWWAPESFHTVSVPTNFDHQNMSNVASINEPSTAYASSLLRKVLKRRIARSRYRYVDGLQSAAQYQQNHGVSESDSFQRSRRVEPSHTWNILSTASMTQQDSIRDEIDLLYYQPGFLECDVENDALFLCDRCVFLMRVVSALPMLAHELTSPESAVHAVCHFSVVAQPDKPPLTINEILLAVQGVTPKEYGEEAHNPSWFDTPMTSLDLASVVALLQHTLVAPITQSNPNTSTKNVKLPSSFGRAHNKPPSVNSTSNAQQISHMWFDALAPFAVEPVKGGPAERLGLRFVPVFMIESVQKFVQSCCSYQKKQALSSLENAILQSLCQHDPVCSVCGKFGGAQKLTTPFNGPGPRSISTATLPCAPASCLVNATLGQCERSIHPIRGLPSIYDPNGTLESNTEKANIWIQKLGQMTTSSDHIESSNNDTQKSDPIDMNGRLWTHVFCVLSMTGGTFVRPERMSGPSLRKVHGLHWRDICYLCAFGAGACMRCPITKRALHSMCGVAAGCDIEWNSLRDPNAPFVYSPGYNRMSTINPQQSTGRKRKHSNATEEITMDETQRTMPREQESVSVSSQSSMMSTMSNKMMTDFTTMTYVPVANTTSVLTDTRSPPPITSTSTTSMLTDTSTLPMTTDATTIQGTTTATSGSFIASSKGFYMSNISSSMSNAVTSTQTTLSKSNTDRGIQLMNSNDNLADIRQLALLAIIRERYKLAWISAQRAEFTAHCASLGDELAQWYGSLGKKIKLSDVKRRRLS